MGLKSVMLSLNVVVLLSEVAEHVTIVTVDVPTEDLDAMLGAQLVHTHHQIPGAACQTHLRDEQTVREGQVDGGHQVNAQDDQCSKHLQQLHQVPPSSPRRRY